VGNVWFQDHYLTIVSHIPERAIHEVKDCLNFLCKSNVAFDFDKIKRLFFRDRICQAVGRVIGYRGIAEGIDSTYLLIHSSILAGISDYLYQEEDMQFYYTLDLWPEIQTTEFLEFEASVNEDKRIDKAKKATAIDKEKQRFCHQIEEKLDNAFFVDENQELTFTEIRQVIRKWKIISYTGEFIRPGIVANYFGLDKHRTSARDKETKKTKAYTYLKGIGVK
jgi:hypothetical protein